MSFRVNHLYLLTIFLSTLFCLAVEAADPTYAGEVVAPSGVRTRTIQISGQPSALAQQAQQLFGLHGGYEQVSTRPDFNFAFAAVQGNGGKPDDYLQRQDTLGGLFQWPYPTGSIVRCK